MLGSAALLASAPAMAETAVAPRPPAAAVAVPSAASQTVADFYKARNGAPLWFSPSAGDAEQQLVHLLSTANIDGLNPQKYFTPQLAAAIQAAQSGKRKYIERADVALSNAFVTYVEDMHQDPGVGVSYVDPSLRPTPPSPLAALLGAASAPSLSDYVTSIGWMNPLYGQLRKALAEHQYTDEEKRQALEINLQRTRALPSGNGRYILVNAAQQRLYMYDDRKPVDSMVVVVGKPIWPTPMMTAYIRYAALNPYWYVPPDLAWEDVGQWVKKYGFSYFTRMGYEQVDDWTANPKILDATKIDWDAVRDGKEQVLLRQNPGPNNFMGRMKFMFPNQFGVYLHDNPRRELFEKSVRYFSGGCVRLEDAARLGRWLFGYDLDWKDAGTEQPVPLAQPVPVYITYLTAMPDGQSIAYYDDAYGRDKAMVAGTDSGKTAAPGPASVASR